MSNNIQLGWGEQTLDKVGNKFTIMSVTPGKKSRQFPSKVMTAMSKFPATSSASAKGIVHVGKVYQQSFQSDASQFLRLTFKGTFHGATTRNALVALRLRQDAPMLIISAKVIRSGDSSLGDKFIMFQGHADIMTVEEVEELELPLTRGERPHMEEEAVESAFEIQTLFNNQTKGAPKVIKVKDREGKVKAVSIGSERKRAVRRRTRS